MNTLNELLNSPKRISITTHHKPDGDAIGSSLGLYHYLINKGHDVTVVSPSNYAHFLHWMPGNESIICYDENRLEQVRDIFNNSDIIFCLDFNALHRIYDLESLVRESNAIKVMIDHHIDPEGFDDYRFWDTKACATAELVYLFIEEVMHDIDSIDQNMATCLYAGIVSDTGCFRFPSTRPITHHIAAELMKKGISHSLIHSHLFENQNERTLRFLGFCLTQKLQILPELHTAIMCITKEEIARYHIETGETEGLVNYPLSIPNIHLSVVAIERSDMVKLSFRSKGDIPANEMCKLHFEGGGHKNAAGGKSELNIYETEKKIYSILPEFASYLRF